MRVMEWAIVVLGFLALNALLILMAPRGAMGVLP